MRRSRSDWVLRPWSKKRGRRSRTGPLRGVLGELAFYLGVILLGVFVLALVLITHVMMPRMNLHLPDEARRVLDSQLAHGGGGWGRWIVGVVSIVAIGSGVVGLAYRLLHLGFSQERRSARAGKVRVGGASPAPKTGSPPTGPLQASPPQSGQGKAAEEQATQPPADASQEDSFTGRACLPGGQAIHDSPGERLRYRLGIVATGRWALFGSASLALIWNSVCFVLLAVVVSGWWYGRNRPILALLLIFFFVIAIWALRVFLRQVRQIAGVGPTILEISEHPLQPGGHYELFVSQMGRMRLKTVRIDLICEEESFFRQGTDVRADRHIAFTQELLREKGVRVDPMEPWQQELSFDVPANAMHSFVATHNAIRWRLVVSGESRPWPSFCRSFPVIVHPPLMAPPDSPR